ncbi:kinase-like domain-containing protein [Aspergillus falconensis]
MVNTQLSNPQGILVGSIFTWNPDTGDASSPLDIYSRQEIYVGRDPRKCQYVIKDPFVSNKHLWIYTVIFDQDNPGEVAPLVYAQDISMNGSLWNNYRMRNGRSSFLLSDGDILRLSEGVYLIYRSFDNAQPTYFDPFQALEMRAFSHEYVITRRKLGSGAYGQVHMAYKKSTGQQFACKIINLLAVKHQLAKEGEVRHDPAFGKNISAKVRDSYVRFQLQGTLEKYHREAKILETLQHPNIIGLEKVIVSGNTIYMFQDLLTAGDLFSYIQYKGGRLTDIEAAVIVRQIVIALDYLHDRNIVHRDLKPDNILMTALAEGCRVVLTDFGCATFVDPMTNRMLSTVGTFEFSAPEVVKQNRGGYTKAADLWSLGCLAAVLLTGEPVFDNMPRGRNGNYRLKAIKNLEVKMNRLNVGERAQDFVFRLLQHDVCKRMDVKQALQHTWFTNPSHKADFEALYKRSIRDWKPRTADKPLIVKLDTYVNRQTQNQTMSDVKNPTMAEMRNLTVSEIKNEHSFVAESSSQAMPVPPSTGETDDESLESLSDMVLLPYHDNSRKSCALAAAAVSVMQPMTNYTSGTKRSHSGDDGGEDGVYEEIINPMTGKRQQLVYGSWATSEKE